MAVGLPGRFPTSTARRFTSTGAPEPLAAYSTAPHGVETTCHPLRPGAPARRSYRVGSGGRHPTRGSPLRPQVPPSRMGSSAQLARIEVRASCQSPKQPATGKAGRIQRHVRVSHGPQSVEDSAVIRSFPRMAVEDWAGRALGARRPERPLPCSRPGLRNRRCAASGHGIGVYRDSSLVVLDSGRSSGV